MSILPDLHSLIDTRVPRLLVVSILAYPHSLIRQCGNAVPALSPLL